MKKLSVVLAVVLGLSLMFSSIVGMAGDKPLYMATGGVTIKPYYFAEWATFSFTAQNLGGTSGRGQAIWIDHKPFNHDEDIFYKIDVDYAEYVEPGQMIFGGRVVDTNHSPNLDKKIYFWVVDGGSPGSGNDQVGLSWEDLNSWGYYVVGGGNLVVHE